MNTGRIGRIKFDGFDRFETQTREVRGERKKRVIVLVSVVIVFVVVGFTVVVAAVSMSKMKTEEAQKKATNDEDGTTGCGPFNVTYSESAPSFIASSASSFYSTGCKITGNCWTRTKCYDCLEGPNKDKVGNLNHIPVCCPNCGRYGLSLSWSSCHCANT